MDKTGDGQLTKTIPFGMAVIINIAALLYYFGWVFTILLAWAPQGYGEILSDYFIPAAFGSGVLTMVTWRIVEEQLTKQPSSISPDPPPASLHSYT
jgi:hypothetical protein